MVVRSNYSHNRGDINLSTQASMLLSGQEGGSLSGLCRKHLQLAGNHQCQGLAKGSIFDLAAGNASGAGSLGGLGKRLNTAGFTDTIRLNSKAVIGS